MLRIRTLLNKRPVAHLLSRSSTRSKVTAANDDNTFDGHRNTVVMSFGDGTQGALGLPAAITGHGADAYEPTPIPGLPGDVIRVSAGHYHSLAVTSGGQLWAWGRDQEAQLGRGTASSRDTWNEPKRVEGLDGVQVVSAFASGVVSAAVGNDGSLWVWGRSKRGQLGLGDGIIETPLPSRVGALAGERITKVSFGWGHALALSEDGKLFGWGYHADGRIGNVGGIAEVSPLDSVARVSNGDPEVAERLVLEDMDKEKDMPVIWEPCFVEELHGSKVLDVACGLDHSLVLCGDGTLFSSGSNVYGQLGRRSTDIGLFPVDVTSNHPLSIASGLGHSLAIYQVASSDDEGDSTSILSWGWNQRSQLGRQGQENLPLEVEGLAGENPISVAGGRVHSIALTSKREVWAWGCGKNGRLGLGSSFDEAEPFLIESLEGCEVLQVVSGFDHNLVLVAQ